MRPILIDTDTASDDAVALIMALREPSVRVVAITVVAGNVVLPQAVKNALIAVQTAATYAPPVYAGCAKPLLRPLFTAENVHGADGMGDMNLPNPTLSPAPEHASDAIIEYADRYANQLEIVTLGPLTNLALALSKAPHIAHHVRRVYIMGGTGLGHGNVTPVAEFNIYVDAEAAQIVLNSGMDLVFVGWDVSTDETFITAQDIARLLTSGSSIAEFCVRCNATLRQYNATLWGKDGIDLPDPTTMAAALYPDIITQQTRAYVYADYQSVKSYGQLVIDRYGLLKEPPNATLCLAIDARRFKDLLFRLLQ